MSLKKDVGDGVAIPGLGGGGGVNSTPTHHMTLCGLNGTKPAPFQLLSILVMEKPFGLAFMNPLSHSTFCNVATPVLTI